MTSPTGCRIAPPTSAASPRSLAVTRPRPRPVPGCPRLRPASGAGPAVRKTRRGRLTSSSCGTMRRRDAYPPGERPVRRKDAQFVPRGPLLGFALDASAGPLDLHVLFSGEPRGGAPLSSPSWTRKVVWFPLSKGPGGFPTFEVVAAVALSWEHPGPAHPGEASRAGSRWGEGRCRRPTLRGAPGGEARGGNGSPASWS
jgi:hypothetical protein